MAGEKLVDTIRSLRQFITQKGWSITDEKEIAHGYQLLVTDGKNKVPVALYTTGKTLIQGKASVLQTELKTWDTQRQQSTTAATTSQAAFQTQTLFPLAAQDIPQQSNATGVARIGSDESGKGDFFGPLVVASVYVDKNTEPSLLQLGVRDSKKLTDKAMRTMAEQIKDLCPHSVLTYLPEQYNQRYQALPNLNFLLAQAHTQVILKTARTTPAELVIVDQFGDEALVRSALRDAGCTLKLEQRHRAEEDTAVAAASIIARAEFVQQLTMLSETIGIDLPKGASNPRIVEVGREIVKHYGKDGLRKVAKLHFKTTENILNA